MAWRRFFREGSKTNMEESHCKKASGGIPSHVYQFCGEIQKCKGFQKAEQLEGSQGKTVVDRGGRKETHKKTITKVS